MFERQIAESKAKRDPNWIEHKGADRPCLEDTIVDVLYRNGIEYRAEAGRLVWEHQQLPGDIIGYRFPSEGDVFHKKSIVKNTIHDPVNHPKHYTNHPSGIECIQITEHMGFNLGNAVKYIWRADLKLDALEDLRKAVWYINREIAKRESVSVSN